MATPKATPDYTELRNVAAPAGNNPKLEPFSDYIFVAGLPHPDNAGLQGLFGWRLGSLFVDDGGTVVKPNSTPTKSKGQWHRVFDGPLCVKWFGAKGNGSADDTKAIQATVLAATVSKKPSLYFPPGRYRLSQAIELTTDDFTLSGTAGAVLVLEPSTPVLGQWYRPEGNPGQQWRTSLTSRGGETNHDPHNCAAINVDGSGIGLRAVDHVTITGGRVSRSPGNVVSHQEYGVGLYSGGSAYVDVAAGSAYRKTSGTGDVGWQKVT